MTFPRVAIVGAGVSGLSCARHLSNILPSASLTIFEKSRFLSGRCATKTNFHAPIDHGAPFFTMSSPLVRHILSPLLGDDLRSIPSDAVIDLQGNPCLDRRGSRYYCASGNSAVGTALAQGLDVLHHAHVTEVHSDASVRVRVLTSRGEEERHLQFDAVALTIPLPQAGKVLRPPPDRAADWMGSFEPCLTALLWYKTTVLNPMSRLRAALDGKFYALQTGDVFTTCENFKSRPQRKDEEACVMVQAGPNFSNAHIDADPSIWMQSLQKRAEELWDVQAVARTESFAKIWRFARVRGESRTLVGGSMTGPVILGGDGVSEESKVENAILEGLSMAKKLADILSV